jgi:hypothetical protein
MGGRQHPVWRDEGPGAVKTLRERCRVGGTEKGYCPRIGDPLATDDRFRRCRCNDQRRGHHRGRDQPGNYSFHAHPTPRQALRDAQRPGPDVLSALDSHQDGDVRPHSNRTTVERACCQTVDSRHLANATFRVWTRR